VDSVLAGIRPAQRFARQVPDVQHVVRRGESLSEIAHRYDTSVRDLMIMNNLRSAHRIRAGQTLRLPLEGEQPIQGDIYRVAAGDTLSGIARRAGLGTRELAAANDLAPDASLQVGQTLDVSLEDEGRAESTRERPEPITATIPLPPASPGWPGNDPVGALTDRIAELTGPEPGPPAGTPSLAATLATPSVPPLVAESNVDRELTADPSDYSVAEDDSIEIQAAETLGHYAEWLDLRAQDLRDLNGMRYGEPLVIGERLELDFAEVSHDTFEQRRKQHHRKLQAAFFEEHHIRGSRTYVIESGDSLWSLTRPTTEVPVWLLRQYNPDLDFNNLKPGTRVQVPVIENQSTGEVARNETGARSN
jgi:membrane-bound lytic murein transglycosylase D